MNSNFKANLDLFLVFLKVMFNQDNQSQADVDTSDTTSQSIIKTWNNELTTTDDERLNTVDPIQVSNAYKMLNHFIKDKTKTNIKKEDEVDIFGRLLAIRLRQFSRIQRQEIMYEIDGLFLDRCRQLHCSPPAIEVNTYSDSDPFVTPPGDYLVSDEESNISVNHIIDGMLGSPVNYLTDESYSSGAISFDSFASFDVKPSSTHMVKNHHGLKVCNNVTCDATQTYVRTYLSPGLIFECE